MALGTKERRAREAEARRRGILDAARGVFAANGFEGTTMPQVAEVAELAAGTLYLYFPSKAAMYAELALEAYQRLEDRLREAVDSDGTPRERAERLGWAFVGFAQEDPADYDMIFFVLRHEAGGWEGALEADQVQRLRKHQAAATQMLIELMRAQKPDAGEAELLVTANAVWAMLAGVVFYFKGTNDFQPVAEEAIGLLLKAVFQ